MTATTVTNLPASASAVPQSYIPTLTPQSEPGEAKVIKWVLANLLKIKTAVDQTTVMTPQSATKAPANPQDGMQRLARAPWCPITAGVTNVWVFFDITANSGNGGWVAL